MQHLAGPQFWEAYEDLPETIQRLADKSFQLLKPGPRHPSLHLKKVGNFWSVRIGRGYRALAVQNNENLIWFWIGTHADYDKLVRKR